MDFEIKYEEAKAILEKMLTVATDMKSDANTFKKKTIDLNSAIQDETTTAAVELVDEISQCIEDIRDNIKNLLAIRVDGMENLAQTEKKYTRVIDKI